MSSDKFTDDQKRILDKVEKLMRLAAKNPNEHEAAAASARAMELLAAYNLDASAIDIENDSGKRAEEKLMGGFYKFERDLWQAISELNFVRYFNRMKITPMEEQVRSRHWNLRLHRQHVLIGKTVNIAGTKAMAGYLMETIERLTKEHTEKVGEAMRSQWASSFRRGVAERVVEKLNQRRWDVLDAEEKRMEEAAKKAREAGCENVETALTLAGVKEREDEGNYDFIHGKGAYAKRRAERAERQQRQAEREAAAEAEYTAWAAANPELAAKQEADRIKRARRRSNSYRGWGRSAPAFKGDWSAYSMGRAAGKDVGIDPQTKGTNIKGHLR